MAQCPDGASFPRLVYARKYPTPEEFAALIDRVLAKPRRRNIVDPLFDPADREVARLRDHLADAMALDPDLPDDADLLWTDAALAAPPRRAEREALVAALTHLRDRLRARKGARHDIG